MESELNQVIREALEDMGIFGVDNVLIALVNNIVRNSNVRRSLTMQAHLKKIATVQRDFHRDVMVVESKDLQQGASNAKPVHDCQV